MIENIKARFFAKRFNIWKEEIDINDKEGYFIYNKQIYFGDRFFVFNKSNQILFRLELEEENKNLYAEVEDKRLLNLRIKTNKLTEGLKKIVGYKVWK